MFTSTRTVKDPCRRKSDRHASVLSQKLVRTSPAHRQIANSKFIDSYADILYQLSHQGSPNSSVGKESACNSGGPGLIPGLGRSPGEGIGYPLQYSGLQNAMDLYSPWGHEESGTNDPLSLSHVDIIKK